jgi:putative ABC transport system permease protein
LAFYTQLEEKLASLPDVTSVGAVTRLPLLAPNSNITTAMMIEGRPVPIGELPEVDFRRASTGYFQTMGIPVTRGRLFSEREAIETAPVVIINEALAERFYPGEDPVGKRIKLGPNPDSAPWLTIIGVVGNVRHLALEIEPRPEVYRHYFTLPASSPILVVRTRSDPRAIISAIRSEVRTLDRNVPVSLVSTMDELVSRSVAGRRFSVMLLGVLSVIALVLAAVGIYGVLSYAVAQRTQEIGIRMAFGARRNDIVTMVLRQALKLSVIGIVLGLSVTLWATRIMAGFLYGVSSTDPVTLAGISTLMLAVALIASYIPARRASRTEPMIALRFS